MFKQWNNEKTFHLDILRLDVEPSVRQLRGRRGEEENGRAQCSGWTAATPRCVRTCWQRTTPCCGGPVGKHCGATFTFLQGTPQAAWTCGAIGRNVDSCARGDMLPQQVRKDGCHGDCTECLECDVLVLWKVYPMRFKRTAASRLWVWGKNRNTNFCYMVTSVLIDKLSSIVLFFFG